MMRILISVVVALAIVFTLTWVMMYRTGRKGGSLTPQAIVTSTTAKANLALIAHAEQGYFALNGRYATLDELKADSSLAIDTSGRDGYTYTIERAESGFTARAGCASPPPPGCTAMMVDQTMEVRPAP